MLKVRWLWELSAFVFLGALASFAMSSFHSPAGVLLVLLVPLLVLLLPAALGQGVRNVGTLMKSFTWWQGLWMLVFLSGLVLRRRDLREIAADPVDASAIFRIALVTVTALLLAVRLALKQTPWIGSMFRGLVGVLTTYTLVSVASTLWSVFPAWTLYKSLEYLVDVALLAAILATVRSAETYKTLFNWTWTLYGLLLASVWLGVLVWPREALEYGVGTLGVQLMGVLPGVASNGVGDCGAILAVVAFSRLLLKTGGRHDQAWYSLLLAAGLVTLVFSQTRSAIAGFAVGVVAVLLFSGRVALGAFLGFVAMAPLLLEGVRGSLWEFLQRGESDRNLQSFSGRLNYWQFAWEKFLQHPLTGYGAYAGGRFVVMQQLNLPTVSSTHSDFVEVLVGTSIWGLIPVLIALLGAWWLLVRSVRNPCLEPFEKQLAVEAIGTLGVLSVRSSFSAELIWHPPLLFLVTLGYAEFLRRRNRYRGVTVAQLVPADRQ